MIQRDTAKTSDSSMFKMFVLRGRHFTLYWSHIFTSLGVIGQSLPIELCYSAKCEMFCVSLAYECKSVS